MSQQELELGLVEITKSKDSALFSPCGLYRYDLHRYFDDDIAPDRPLVAIGLNPSTADAFRNDPTVRKDIGFAKLWGCGRLIKLNSEAFRATDPADLKRARKVMDTVGPDNDWVIQEHLETARQHDGIVLVAWGNHVLPKRQRDLAYLIKMAGLTPMCLKVNDNGTPSHELYVSYETPLQEWTCP